ncbi:MAG: hypothetical protein V2I54_12815 [Bacteroidales bacterium]|jgi:hypothetical protein|nr:hypothetical protein [Bacteroidales bacterium]
MNKFGSYKILKKEGVIIEYHSGDIDIEDLISSKKIISSDNEYSSDYDVVSDVRDTNIILSPEDVDKYVIFFKKYAVLQGSRKLAFITRKPQHLVFTTLFSDGIKDTPINTEIFSTLKAVVNWVDSSYLNEKVLKGIIEGLKKSPNTLYLFEELRMHNMPE